MDVFLAGIIQGSHIELVVHLQDWRQHLIRTFEEHLPEARVYDHFAVHPEAVSYEQHLIEQTLEEGNARAAASDVLVAWIPEASMGTGIEMYLAAKAGAVVVAVTPMVKNWVVRVYADRVLSDLEAFRAFVASGELARLVEEKRGIRLAGAPTAAAGRRVGR